MSIRVRRFDSVTIGQPTVTAQGFLRIPAKVSKVGVLEYPQADGKVWRELVTEDALFNPECMDSMSGIPYTDLHPLEAVTPENARDHTRGHFGDHAHKDGDDGLGTDIYVTDAALIADIKAGNKREVSMGYFATLDRTPGTWKGQQYDAKQVHRIYNHGAAVPQGRAGHDVRLKMDSNLELVEQEPLMKVVIDGVGEVEMTEAQASAYKAKLATAPQGDAAATTATTKALAEAQARADAAEAEANTLKAAEAAKNNDAAKAAEIKARQDAVNAKVALIATASKFVPADKAAGLATMDATEIMKTAILAQDPEAKMDGKNESYLQARFDLLVEKGITADATKDLGTAVLEGRFAGTGAGNKDAKGEVKAEELHGKPGRGIRSDAFQERHHQTLNEAWRKPLNPAKAL